MADIKRLVVFGSLAVVVVLGTAGNMAGASSDRRVRPGSDRGTECPDGRPRHDDCYREHRRGSDKREAKEHRKAEEREAREKARHEGKKEKKKKHHDKKKHHKQKHFEKKHHDKKKHHKSEKHYDKKQHHKKKHHDKKHHDKKHYDKKHSNKHHKKKHYEKNVIIVFQPGGGGGPKPEPPDRHVFVVHLTADQLNPPGPLGASGVANLLLDLDEDELCFYVAYQGLAGATVAHIHRSAPGPDPLVLDLGPTFSGGRDCFDADEDALEDIADDPGDHYLHLHTLPNLDVAVQGRLVRPFNP